MCLFVYTDGACRRSGDGAWAFVAVSNGREIYNESGKDTGTTNNRMELNAIVMGLAWAAKQHVDNVIIVTDSKYSIAVLTRPDKANPFPLPKNIDLIRIGRSIMRGMSKIKFEWVKGHSGNQWNERADALAVSLRDGTDGPITVRRAPGKPARVIRPSLARPASSGA